MTLFVERRRPTADAELVRRTAVAFLLIALLAIATNFKAIAGMRFPDPDDTLRLVQVRDLIAGQGWFDLHQHRVDAVNGGVPMHWSRLVDIPLAAVILALTPLVGQASAEMAALVGVPLLTFGVAIFLAGRIAWRTLDGEVTTFACLALALSVPVVSQLRPMRIDHHGWQIVLALAAVNGLMARDPRKGGWVIGLSLAAWLAISIEGLPFAVALMAVVALRWLRRGEDKEWLLGAIQALAAGSVALFLATRGVSDLAVHCDAISPVHLAIFGWGALALTALGTARPHPGPFILAGFVGTAIGGLAILWLAVPQCTQGGFVGLDPLVRQYWYSSVAEGLPVWRQPVPDMLQIVVPPVIGLLATVKLANEASDWLRRWWLEYALLLGAALVLALFVARAGAVAGALAAVPLGWQICEWLRAARRLHRPGKRALAFAGVALALLPALPVTLITIAVPAQASSGQNSTRLSTCNLPGAAVALQQLPAGEILAPLDIGPRLIYETDHRVIATGHHRGNPAMHAVIATFLGSPEAAHGLVRARRTAYVALCPDLVEPANYATDAPDGFAAQLMQGKAPAWLEPVPMKPGVGLKFWKVVG